MSKDLVWDNTPKSSTDMSQDLGWSNAHTKVVCLKI